MTEVGIGTRARDDVWPPDEVRPSQQCNEDRKRWASRPLVPPLSISIALLARTYFTRWPHAVTRSGANPDLGYCFLTTHLTFIPSSFTSAGLSSRTYFGTPDVFLIARPHASPTAGWMGSPAGGAWGSATTMCEEAEPPPASSATHMRL